MGTVFLRAGCVVDNNFYYLSFMGNYLVRLNVNNKNVSITDIFCDTVECSDLFPEIIEREGHLIILPRNKKYVSMIDLENSSVKRIMIEDCGSYSNDNYFFSGTVFDNRVFLFPGNSKFIIAIDIDKPGKDNIYYYEVEAYERPVFGTVAYNYNEKILLNPIFPQDVGGYIGVFDPQNGEIEFMTEVRSKHGFLDIQSYSGRLYGLFASGSFCEIDIDNHCLSYDSSTVFDIDEGYRTMVINEGFVYCFSIFSGIIQISDINSGEKREVSTEYDGFNGVNRIDDKRFIAFVGIDDLVILNLDEGEFEIVDHIEVYKDLEMHKQINSRQGIITEETDSFKSFLRCI